MAIAWRNTLSGSGAVSLTSLNTAGPSSFTGGSIKGGTFAANPGAGRTPVLKSVLSGADKSRLDLALTETVSAVSSTIRVRFVGAIPTATWQLLNWQASTPSQRTGYAINLQTSGLIQLAASGDSATVYKSTAAGIVKPDVWLRINSWADIDAGTCGYAIYDEAGAQLATQAFTGIDLGQVGVTKYVQAQAGKVDTSSSTATFMVSVLGYQLGEAVDMGPAPAMAVATPPTVDFIPAQIAEAGDVVWVTARAKPTTSGATEAGITTAVVSAVDSKGAAFPAAVPLLTFAAPASATATTPTGATVTITPMQSQVTTAPYLPRTAVYTLQTTGRDSNGLAASRTHTLTVIGHPVWLDGKPADLRPGTGVA